MSEEVPESLRRARRSLEELAPFIAIRDWVWDESVAEWCLSFTACLEHPDRVPQITSWVFSVSSAYPDCRIKIYPSLDGGIEDTHPHQSNNGMESHGKYCRSGNICLFTENAEWGLRGSSDFTLLSHAERFLQWLEAANEGRLMKDGDHAEFPMQNIRRRDLVLYCEDEVSKMIWDSHPSCRDGVVEITENNLGQTCLSAFYEADSSLVRGVGWGTIFEGDRQKKTDRGIWFLASSVPHVRCWQSPNTYGELREWAKGEKLDLDDIIGRNGSTLRDGLRHYLAIGVPCSSVVGEEPVSLSWFVAIMPALANEKEFGKGGVHKRKVLRTVDGCKTFAPNVLVDWIDSANCSKNQMFSRGSLCEELADSRIALIGAGSLGSMVANSLIRGGVTDLCIFDSDSFGIGNVTRHHLRACDAGADKAATLAAVLNTTSPMAEVKGRSAIDKDNAATLKGFDIIIDCSSSPSVLAALDNLEGGQALFVCSFGYAAERVYISLSTLSSFFSERYRDTFRELMREEANLMREKELPWEGVGCWSPVFPAKNSDVSRAASIVVDCIDRLVEKRKTKANYVYITKRDADGILTAIERVEL
ncbi:MULTISPECIES: ThiF family adenylyltransferase [unclassified Adlercreutzia]|uniref:ThiF family adenylyltransferase n=1 Tax=unclassified Adlercreutzia TaxID=2636013 RepID=UPI0013ED91BB|nr:MULTISPECIES: ThiF family adenylyltransferase [unclassified Adlercreutzia]